MQSSQQSRNLSDTLTQNRLSVDTQTFEVTPVGLIFRPSPASQIEPRLGVEKMIDTNLLTLNIGSSVDLFSWKTTNGKEGVNSESELRLGADMFTWTQIRSEGDFRFPVEDVDYLFGLNMTWRYKYQNSNLPEDIFMPVEYSIRIRLAHISAHTVDGQYDNYTQKFIFQQPYTYSKEFIDALYSYQNYWHHAVGYRLFAGAMLLVHVIPTTLTAFAPHYGFVLSGAPATLTPYLAYDGRVEKVTAWQGDNSLQLGVKLGKWDEGGMSLYAGYYQGKNVHGELYFLNTTQFSIGTNFSF